MPIARNIWDSPNHAQIAIWDITENEAFFLKHTPLHPDDLAALHTLNPTRKLESLASRQALFSLLPAPSNTWFLQKDDCRKPFLTHLPDLYCSLSHTKGIAAAMISLCNCGLDIQVFSPKMPKLVSRFLHDEELLAIDLAQPSEQQRMDLYHFLWTSKETLYKIYGKLELDFRQQMRLSETKLPYDSFPGTCKGLILPFAQPPIQVALHWRKIELHGLMNYLCYGMVVS